jgi:PPP family 3-phenylpropionic acid transporter
VRERQGTVLGAAYALNFAALASSSPFLALHLAKVGFSPEGIADLLASLLLVRVVAVPGWTLLADRTRSIPGVLRLVTGGAAIAMALLLEAKAPPWVALALLAFATLRAPFAPLLDALTLAHARDAGRPFGAVRAWGTAGYALGAVATGKLVARYGPSAIIDATVALLAAAFAMAWLLRGHDAVAREREETDTFELVASLLRRRRVILLLIVALLSEVGLAPYDALFPAYLTSIGGASAAGMAVAVGAAAEFLFLLASGSLARRLGPERLLVLASAISCARWGAMAFVSRTEALVALQVAHAASFGAFYLGSVLVIDEETPPSLRASGLGIFGSLCFGVAAALALSLAGAVERAWSMRAVFAVAAVASALASGVAVALRRSET